MGIKPSRKIILCMALLKWCTNFVERIVSPIIFVSLVLPKAIMVVKRKCIGIFSWEPHNLDLKLRELFKMVVQV